MADAPINPQARRLIPALRVRQWRHGWDDVDFLDTAHRRRPDPHFFLFSIPAVELRSLCGISRRDVSDHAARVEDLGIQRQHDQSRSDEISRYIDYGFPWSTLSEAKRRSEAFNNLRKPGWLPTAIVVNILRDVDRRQNNTAVAADDAINVQEANGAASLQLPYSSWSSKWRPSALPPLEIIDGQHRLFAFHGEDQNFDLPVVAFYGLDVSWQAYLFWTINIKPVRINPSLAFDLYPLLRGEDWLDRAEGHPVYRETRAQELTEAMWAHPQSPWYDRINMLGERNVGGVTQSAWVKSLTATFVRSWRGRGTKLGGLFGGRLSDEDEVLGWSRAQQAAFLVYSWRALRDAVAASDADWAKDLRKSAHTLPKSDDRAFYGPHSLIETDQGIRGILHTLNDICFASAARLELNKWAVDESAGAADEAAVSRALNSLTKQKVAALLSQLADALANFDWRSSSTPGLSTEERRAKLVFRGSGGYKELRHQLLEHLSASGEELKVLVERVEALA